MSSSDLIRVSSSSSSTSAAGSASSNNNNNNNNNNKSINAGRNTPTLVDQDISKPSCNSLNNSGHGMITTSSRTQRPPSMSNKNLHTQQKRPSTEQTYTPEFTNWNIQNPSLRPVPSFYPLEKSSRIIHDSPSNVASRISDVCRLMSVHAVFDDELATADLRTDDHVEIHLTLWNGSSDVDGTDDHGHGHGTDGAGAGADADAGTEKGATAEASMDTDTDTEAEAPAAPAPATATSTIVEAQRRKGCSVVYHRYCRNILDAAQGCFDFHHAKEDVFMSMTHPHPPSKQRVEVERKDGHGHKHGHGGTHGHGNEEEIETKSSLYALEIAASLLKKDRMDARRLGMESLCLLTDPSKTGLENAIVASQVVLFGSADLNCHNNNGEDDTNFIPDELGIREAILSLVQYGKIREYCDFDSDDEDDENISSVEVEFNEVLHNLALAVLANALEVLEMYGLETSGATAVAASAASLSSSPSANAFLEESQEISKRELLSTLLNVLGQAQSKPHDACLSAQCLKSLFQASKKAKRRAKDLNAKQIVMTALDVGRRTHVKLETETENVIRELERQDDEDDGAGVARGGGTRTVTGVEYQQRHEDDSDDEE